jgi:hypothetical protein
MPVACEACRVPRLRAFIVLIGLQIMAGCAGVPVASPSAERAAGEPKRDFRACMETVAAKPENERLSGKLYLGANDVYPAAYLANPDRPAANEIELLRVFHADLQECRKLQLATTQPSTRNAVVDSQRAEDRLWTQAITGRLTWGKFNAGRKDIASRLQARLAEQRAQTNVDPWRQNTLGSDQDNTGLPHYGKPDEVPAHGPFYHPGRLRGSTQCNIMIYSRECQTAR